MSDSYYSQGRAEILPFVPQGPGEALEIGCGAGHFGQLLRETFGYRVTGVEPFPEAFAEARTRLPAVYRTTAEQFISSHQGKYDVIFFNDVLEHLVDPWAQLRGCHHLLRSAGGVIIASLPNIRYLRALKTIVFRRDFPYQDGGIFDRTHLRFFTRKSMVRMFEESGYSVLRCEGINKMRSWQYVWGNRLTLRIFEEVLFMQFVVVAKSSENPNSL